MGYKTIATVFMYGNLWGSVVVCLIWGSNPKGLLACPRGGACIWNAPKALQVIELGFTKRSFDPICAVSHGILTQKLWQLMLPLKVKIIMENNMNWMYYFLLKLKVIWISIVAFCYLVCCLDIMSPLMVSCKNTLGLIFYDNAITEIAYPDLYTEWLVSGYFYFYLLLIEHIYLCRSIENKLWM